MGIGLAVVRSLAAPQHLRTAQEAEDFEQELVDQYALAMAASGVTDGHLAQQRATVFDSSGSWAGRCGPRRRRTPTSTWDGCASIAAGPRAPSVKWLAGSAAVG